jgi:SAM-dependent methyltransferase
LDTIIDRSSTNSHSDSNSIEYTSKILQLLADTFEKHQDALVLDVGIVCNENINFFARRVKRLYVCDIFALLNRDQRKGLKTKSVWRHLDYAPKSFDAINLWDLVEHLNDNEAKRLAEICCHILKQDGLLFITDFEKQPVPREVSSFVIGEDFRMSLRPQPNLDLPWYYRHNRALISLLMPFSVAKIFRYRNGIREFLFKHE